MNPWLGIILGAIQTHGTLDVDFSLSPEEVITEKLADFKAADTDGDGKLSFEEVKAFYDKKG